MTLSTDAIIAVYGNNIVERLATPAGTLDLIVIGTIALCAVALLLSVIIDFLEFHENKNAKERRSVVATGTMLLFFFALGIVLRLHIGAFVIDDLRIRAPLMALCLIVVIIGTAVNIKGRYDLGKNWANHIKIYKKHELVTTGVYGVVRHPLYASLLWIAFAASVAYQNWLGILMTALVFLPMMIYRAKQEETLLKERFKKYDTYAKSTPRFFPRTWRRS